MNDDTRTLWSPETELDRELIRQELASILGSPHFSNSKRYPALLGYVVEKTLAGHADHIKERSLGVEVFHRPADYDTNSDTVVRFTAGEIRKRLTLYYHERGNRSPIQIVMPTGSYVPEFYRSATSYLLDEPSAQATALITGPGELLPPPPLSPPPALTPTRPHLARITLFTLLGLAIIGGLIFALRSSMLNRKTSLDRFWGAVVEDRKASALIIPGSVVFDANHFSGTMTADKTNIYPFVSLQMVAAIARLSGQVERRGSTYQIQAAGSTTLTDMRERPLLLVGAYNNPWTIRLLAPLRFYFPPEPNESITDRQHPDVRWARDKSIPYSSADDYALFGRFRDPTTDSTVVFAAGLGRNGTEAAAQFITSPHYMDLLEQRLGNDLANKNIEVVLKINVVEGKTGAPSIQAVHTW